jgi:PKD repeat protein
MRVYNDTNTTGSTVTVDVPFPVAIKPLPKLSWSSFPSKGSKGFPVTFVVLSDIDATGWVWDFGDNSSDNSQAAVVAKTASVTHTYNTKGTYTVSVRARNAEDSSAAPTDIEVGTITVDDIPEYRYLLPVVAHADGIGSTWRTDVQIYTPDPTVSPANPLSLTASFKGQDFPLIVHTSTFIYEDFLARLRPGANEQGPVIMTVRTLHAPQIWTRTYNQTDAGTFGQFIPAIRLDTAGAGSAVGEGRYHLAGLRSDGRYRTNVGIVNPNAQTIPVTLRVYDDVNVPFNAAITKQLAPFQLDQFPVTGPADRPFSVEIEVPAGSWLIAYASLVDGGSGDPVYMQAVRSSELASSDYRTSVIPGVGHVGDWRSDVTIFNPYNHSVTVDLDYYDQSGAKTASATNVPVGPGMFLQYSDLLTQGILGTVPDSLGMLRVTVPTTVSADSFPMTFARTYNDNGGGKTYGQGISGFAASRANVKPGKAALIPAVRSDSSYKTNVGLTNVSSTTANVTVKVLDPITGGEIAQYGYTLEPNQSVVQPNLNLSGRSSASLRVEVTGGNIWAFASIIDLGTLDPEYVPATPLP